MRKGERGNPDSSTICRNLKNIDNAPQYDIRLNIGYGTWGVGNEV